MDSAKHFWMENIIGTSKCLPADDMEHLVNPGQVRPYQACTPLSFCLKSFYRWLVAAILDRAAVKQSSPILAITCPKICRACVTGKNRFLELVHNLVHLLLSFHTHNSGKRDYFYSFTVKVPMVKLWFKKRKLEFL